jgi:hypothetical protein
MLVEVFLIGFDTGGGYGHRQEANALLQLLSPISRHCPHSLTSGEELGVCFNVEYQVVGGDEVGAEASGGARGGCRVLVWVWRPRREQRGFKGPL